MDSNNNIEVDTMTTYDGYNSSKKFKSTYSITLHGDKIGSVRAKSKDTAQRKADERYPHSNVEVKK